VQGDAEPTDREASGPQARGHDSDHARAYALEPLAGDRRRQAEEYDRDREDARDIFQRPVVRRRSDDTEHGGQRRVEDAPRVDRADAQVNGDRRRRHSPAVEPGRGDDVVFVQALVDAQPTNPI
jgi:hypothetical protein